MTKQRTSRSCGIRLGHFMHIRHAMDDELEAVWLGKQDARTALERAVQRGNELLEASQRGDKESRP